MKFHKRFKLLLMAAMLSGMGLLSATAEDEVVFQQDFSKISSLEQAGWKFFPGLATEFNLKNGCLEMLFGKAPYKGGNIHRQIPVIDSGTLTFEVAINTNGAKYDHHSLKIDFYNVTLSFKRYGGHKLIRYYNKQWKDVSDNVPLGKRVKIKVVFDNKEKLVQYFVGDMENPVMIDENVTLVPNQKSAFNLLIGNYGLAAGTIEHKMFNISLSK